MNNKPNMLKMDHSTGGSLDIPTRVYPTHNVPPVSFIYPRHFQSSTEA